MVIPMRRCAQVAVGWSCCTFRVCYHMKRILFLHSLPFSSSIYFLGQSFTKQLLGCKLVLEAMRDEMHKKCVFSLQNLSFTFGKDKNCIQTTTMLSYEIGACLIELKSQNHQGEGKERIVFYLWHHLFIHSLISGKKKKYWLNNYYVLAIV